MTAPVTFSTACRARARADSSARQTSSGRLASSVRSSSSAAADTSFGTDTSGGSCSSAAPGTKSGCAATTDLATSPTALSRGVSFSSAVAVNQSWFAAQARIWASATEALQYANTVARTSVAPHRETGSEAGLPSAAMTYAITWSITVCVRSLIPQLHACCRASRRRRARTSWHRAGPARRGAAMRMPRLPSSLCRSLGGRELKASSTMPTVRSFRAADGCSKAFRAAARPASASVGMPGGDNGGPATTW